MSGAIVLSQLADRLRSAEQALYDARIAVGAAAADPEIAPSLLHGEAGDLLRELAAAVRDMREHRTKRFAREMDRPWEEQSKECQHDWHRVFDQHLSAVKALEEYAEAMMRGVKA